MGTYRTILGDILKLKIKLNVGSCILIGTENYNILNKTVNVCVLYSHTLYRIKY